MTLIFIILATVAVSVISFVGVLVLPLKNKRLLDLSVSFAVGAMLATVFLNILPEIWAEAVEIESYSLIILLTILGLFILERLLHWHHCHCDPEHCDDCVSDHQHFGWINIFGDGLHNFVDGLMIGASFIASWQLGVIAALAVALHELPQEVGDFAILLKSGWSRAKALFWNFISAITAILGGLFAYWFATADKYTPLFLSIAAGSFLYLAMADIMPRLHRSERRTHEWQLIAIVLGVVLIYLANYLLPEAH